MKKITLIICMIATVILLTGCSENSILKDNDEHKDNITDLIIPEQEINDVVMNYYQLKLDLGEGYEVTQIDNYIIVNDLKSKTVKEYEVTVYKTKEFGDKYLVLAKCYDKDGHPSCELLLLQKTDDKYTVLKTAVGDIPMSMAFAVNRAVYENNTILFSVLGDRTWSVGSPDESKEVSFYYIIVEFENGESIKETVTGDKGYIIVLESISDVKDMKLYNAEGELQTSLADLDKYGSRGRDSEFSSVEKYFND
ncbi:MAG: hypothetical protein GX387_10810 [Clostridium sp.]|jgi:hypothetical protein|nr:hypothetical protein [Clostridium sp.]